MLTEAPTAAYVLIPKAAELTGYSRRAIELKIARGEGVSRARSPDPRAEGRAVAGAVPVSGREWGWLGAIVVGVIVALVYALKDWNKPKGPK